MCGFLTNLGGGSNTLVMCQPSQDFIFFSDQANRIYIPIYSNGISEHRIAVQSLAGADWANNGVKLALDWVCIVWPGGLGGLAQPITHSQMTWSKSIGGWARIDLGFFSTCHTFCCYEEDKVEHLLAVAVLEKCIKSLEKDTRLITSFYCIN